MAGSLNRYVTTDGFVNISHLATAKPPAHVPDTIKVAFNEGAKCLAVECYNAAGTMFRLCIDLATKPLLPTEDVDGLNATIRRSLGLRLGWLFDHSKLPEALRDLSSAVKDDGNDGAHAGTLKVEDANDLLDFTVALLRRMFTEPKQLELSKARRTERRKPAQT
jgi:hypothetical protein